MKTDAIISPCGLYRQRLFRQWNDTLPLWLWICLNPSKADARLDDMTSTKIRGFTHRGRGGGYIIENLFDFRATNPHDLWDAEQPMSSDCDLSIATSMSEVVSTGGKVIVAWGGLTNPVAEDRASDVLQTIRNAGVQAHCIGKTAAGFPKHPSRAPYADTFEQYEAPHD